MGSSYDELLDGKTRTRYVSQAGDRYARPQDEAGPTTYREYSLIAGFEGPSGNQTMVIAGMRDVGLMQAGEALTGTHSLSQLSARLPDGPFEALYEVTGINTTNVASKLLIASERKPVGCGAFPRRRRRPRIADRRSGVQPAHQPERAQSTQAGGGELIQQSARRCRLEASAHQQVNPERSAHRQSCDQHGAGIESCGHPQLRAHGKRQRRERRRQDEPVQEAHEHRGNEPCACGKPVGGLEQAAGKPAPPNSTSAARCAWMNAAASASAASSAGQPNADTRGCRNSRRVMRAASSATMRPTNASSREARGTIHPGAETAIERT